MKILNESNFEKDEILSEEICFYYDVISNQRFAPVSLNVKDDVLGKKLYSYKYDIKQHGGI